MNRRDLFRKGIKAIAAVAAAPLIKLLPKEEIYGSSYKGVFHPFTASTVAKYDPLTFDMLHKGVEQFEKMELKPMTLIIPSGWVPLLAEEGVISLEDAKKLYPQLGVKVMASKHANKAYVTTFPQSLMQPFRCRIRSSYKGVERISDYE